jgi:methylenetetrahydrofolate--tRNA-(uracil-5-)-methyltransferase
VTRAIESHPLIEIRRGEVSAIPESTTAEPVIVATGPLTSAALSADIVRFVGRDHLAFFDAISPIVLAESLDMRKVFRQSRWDRSLAPDEPEGDYLNCPMTQDEYLAFHQAIVTAEKAEVHDFDNTTFFEGCLPIEVMAHRGVDTLRFGPMKPAGLTDPRTDRRPYAVVLRRTNRRRSLQSVSLTQLKWGEQSRVLKMIQAGAGRVRPARHDPPPASIAVRRWLPPRGRPTRALLEFSPARCPASRATSNPRHLA